MNIPFVWKGSDFTGVDCLGLLLLFYREELKIDLPFPEYSTDPHDPLNYFSKYYEEYGFKIVLQPAYGDVVTFKTPKGVERHCAIVLNNFQALHADLSGVNIINYVYDPRWVKRIGNFYSHKDRK